MISHMFNIYLNALFNNRKSDGLWFKWFLSCILNFQVMHVKFLNVEIISSKLTHPNTNLFTQSKHLTRLLGWQRVCPCVQNILKLYCLLAAIITANFNGLFKWFCSIFILTPSNLNIHRTWTKTFFHGQWEKKHSWFRQQLKKKTSLCIN